MAPVPSTVSSYCRPEEVVVMVMTKRFQRKKKKGPVSPENRTPQCRAQAKP
jgi:hypothetical protein